METLFEVVPTTEYGRLGQVEFRIPTDERSGRYRNSDPETSKAGAESVKYRAGSQKAKLLKVFASGFPLTDEEAAETADLLRSEFAKRCGELRQDGMIELTGQTRVGHAGVARIVSQITEKGLAAARSVIE